MDSKNLFSFLTRTAVGTLIGALLGFYAAPVIAGAAHVDLPPIVPYLVTAVFMVLANLPYLVNRSAPSANLTGTSTGKGSARTQVDTTPRAPKPAPQPLSAKFTADNGGSKVSYTTTTQPDGSIKVTVTTVGLTGREFKGPGGVRTRLENIGGIKWDNPSNVTAQTKRGSVQKKGGKPVAATAAADANEPTTRIMVGTIARGNVQALDALRTQLGNPASN